jgi:hypothetical protein
MPYIANCKIQNYFIGNQFSSLLELKGGYDV